MGLDETDLKKLLDLNRRGLISDEILANALNERYLKTEKEEVKEEIIDKTIGELDEMMNDLSDIKNDEGNCIYSKSYLFSLKYSEFVKLYNEEKNKNVTLKEQSVEQVAPVELLIEHGNETDTSVESENSVEEKAIEQEKLVETNTTSPFIFKKDYVDSLTDITPIQQDGTIILALAKDENGEMCYVVYQDKCVAGYTWIDPKTFPNSDIIGAQNEYEDRLKKEKEYLDIFKKPEEPPKAKTEETAAVEPIATEESKPMESIFKVSSINNEEKEAEESSGIDFDRLASDSVDSEYKHLDENADGVTRQETDTNFKVVEVSPERREKLKKEKAAKKKVLLIGIGAIAATGLIIATGGGLGLVGWALGAGAITAGVLATKIKRGTWNPQNEEGKYIKHVLEKIMNGKTKENEERGRSL